MRISGGVGAFWQQLGGVLIGYLFLADKGQHFPARRGEQPALKALPDRFALQMLDSFLKRAEDNIFGNLLVPSHIAQSVVVDWLEVTAVQHPDGLHLAGAGLND